METVQFRISGVEASVRSLGNTSILPGTYFGVWSGYQIRIIQDPLNNIQKEFVNLHTEVLMSGSRNCIIKANEQGTAIIIY